MGRSVTEETVAGSYSKAATGVQQMCCPVDVNPEYLEHLPQAIIERDYGCGDPSPYLKEGDTVVDLGSGGGKQCYIASQIVGPTGRVIGVDINDDMLELARSCQAEFVQSVGYDNITFMKGRIEDLQLDLDDLDEQLSTTPCGTEAAFRKLERTILYQKNNSPMIEDDSVDAVISNCVLNLVDESLKSKLLQEIYRVLKRHGRAVISDIVSNKPVPEVLKNDRDLWSGCISGAFCESDLLRELESVGYHGIEILKRDLEPWRVLAGIEFRSLTFRAFKGKAGECWDHQEAVFYKGPYKRVIDDDNHVIERGKITPVCRKTFEILKQSAYKSDFFFLSPQEEIPAELAVPFDCGKSKSDTPAKSQRYSTTDGAACSQTGSSGSSCC